MDVQHHTHAVQTGSLRVLDRGRISEKTGKEACKEVANSFDVGLRRINGRLRFDTSLFYTKYDDYIYQRSVDAGVGADRETRNHDQGKWGFVVYHAMTPETETTTHQFWTVAGHQDKVPEHMRDLFMEQMHGVLKEDLDVYEAQQRAIDMDPDSPNRDANPRGTIPADEGLLAMRRVIRRRYGDEQKALQAAE